MHTFIFPQKIWAKCAYYTQQNMVNGKKAAIEKLQPPHQQCVLIAQAAGILTFCTSARTVHTFHRFRKLNDSQTRRKKRSAESLSVS